jgi:hypothetical protein
MIALGEGGCQIGFARERSKEALLVPFLQIYDILPTILKQAGLTADNLRELL